MKIAVLFIMTLFGVSLYLIWPSSATEYSIADPQVTKLLETARTFPREVFGFTSIPDNKTTKVLVERPFPALSSTTKVHIPGKSLKTITCEKTSAGGFQWTQEREIFVGPEYPDHNGLPLKETVVITYEYRGQRAEADERLSISYTGPNLKLNSKQKIKPEDILDTVKRWAANPEKRQSAKDTRTKVTEFLNDR